MILRRCCRASHADTILPCLQRADDVDASPLLRCYARMPRYDIFAIAADAGTHVTIY